MALKDWKIDHTYINNTFIWGKEKNKLADIRMDKRYGEYKRTGKEFPDRRYIPNYKTLAWFVTTSQEYMGFKIRHFKTKSQALKYVKAYMRKH